MPVDYSSHRFPTNFIRSDENVIQNGSLALAKTAHTIAENQHWNVLRDLPFTNFLLRNGVPTTSENFTVTVRLPPFSQYVAFYFCYIQNFASTGAITVEQYIDISCAASSDSSRATNLPAGEDLTDTGKGFLALGSRGWVYFVSIPDNPLPTAPSALKVITTPVATWSTATVVIDKSENIALLSGAYRVLPNIATLDMDV